MNETFAEKLFKRCMWCENEALFECDAVIGMSAQVGRKQTVVYAPLENVQAWTCDAPMCSRHARVVGHLCAGKDSDSIDHCPYCLKHPPAGGPMLQEEAEEIRRERHAQIRRSLLRVAKES